MTRKTIRLVVTMPDPGEWCRGHDDDGNRTCCEHWSDHYRGCVIGLSLEGSVGAPVRRPQSCRDAELEPCP
jgi:hypothetical protein